MAIRPVTPTDPHCDHHQVPTANTRRDEQLRTLAGVLLRHGHVDWDEHDARTVANAVMESWADPLLAEQATIIDSEQERQMQLAEAVEAYQRHRDAGQMMHAVLLDIWRMADPDDRKDRMFLDPRDVRTTVLALLAEQEGES